MEEKEVEFNLFTNGRDKVHITSDIEEFDDYLTIEEECFLAMYLINDIAMKSVEEDIEDIDIENLTEDDKMRLELTNVSEARDALIQGTINTFYSQFAEKVNLPQMIYEFVMGIYYPIGKMGNTKMNQIMNTAYSEDIKANEIMQTATAIAIDLANDLKQNGMEKADILEVIENELDLIYETVEQVLDSKESG